MIKKEPDYISLKEAAQLSGYSADYIGQLIRNGKLPGKQVFSNVAWVTTREAIAEYVDKDKKTDESPKTLWSRVQRSLMSMETLQRVYVGFVWLLIGIFALVVVFLAYIFAVSIEHKLEERQLNKIQYAQQ